MKRDATKQDQIPELETIKMLRFTMVSTTGKIQVKIKGDINDPNNYKGISLPIIFDYLYKMLLDFYLYKKTHNSFTVQNSFIVHLVIIIKPFTCLTELSFGGRFYVILMAKFSTLFLS